MKNVIYLLVILALFLLASCGGQRAQKTEGEVQQDIAVAPSPPQVVGEEVSYESGGQTLLGYLAYDKHAQGSRPGASSCQRPLRFWTSHPGPQYRRPTPGPVQTQVQVIPGGDHRWLCKADLNKSGQISCCPAPRTSLPG